MVSIGDDYRNENQRGEQIDKVDRRALRVRDSYGLVIAPGQNEILILAATVAVEI